MLQNFNSNSKIFLDNQEMTPMVTAASNNSTGAGGNGCSTDRRCDNNDCIVNKLVSMVPKRKTAQFVTSPSIIAKPMLVNGFTTIFQVDGTAAKISDLKHRNNEDPRTIYRIIPKTHAHIINYVVVDTEGESLRKINNGDPTTMKKLLDSQRLSAEQMLGKLMNGQGVHMQVSNSSVFNGATKMLPKTPVTTVPSKIINKTATPPVNKTPLYVPSSTNVAVTVTTNLATTVTSTTPIISNALGALSKMSTATSAKLPMRSVTIKKVGTPKTIPATSTTPTTIITTASSVMQNLMRLNSSIKVRSVTSSASKTHTVTTTATKTRTSTPLIKTVPLSKLQEPTVAVSPEVTSSLPATPTVASSTATEKSESFSSIEKMQKELEDLRRTVAFLAEKTLSTHSAADVSTESPPNKKPKLT